MNPIFWTLITEVDRLYCMWYHTSRQDCYQNFNYPMIFKQYHSKLILKNTKVAICESLHQH